MYYVYVLNSAQKNQRYVGSTSNIEKRLREHQRGLSKSTKNRGPWRLVYLEEKETQSEAEKREKFFKTGDGRLALKIILKKLQSR